MHSSSPLLHERFFITQLNFADNKIVLGVTYVWGIYLVDPVF